MVVVPSRSHKVNEAFSFGSFSFLANANEVLYGHGARSSSCDEGGTVGAGGGP